MWLCVSKKAKWVIAAQKHTTGHDSLRTVFFLRKKRRAERVPSERSCFFDKNFQFLSKKQLLSNRSFSMSRSMVQNFKRAVSH